MYKPIELAEQLYNAYGIDAEWKNFQGGKMPRWKELPERQRKSWLAVAEAALDLMGA